MLPTALDILPAVFALSLSLIGTRLVLSWLTRRQILDRPNERSSHTRPTPRGGGLAVSPAIFAAWLLALALGNPLTGWIGASVTAAALLMLASWLDDRYSLPVGPRLLSHVAAVAALLFLLPDGALVFQGWLPLWADRLVAALGWLWFINLFNFMDGIDGITGVQTSCLGLGIAVVALISGVAAGIVPLSLVCAAAAIGFLAWNWHPARIFLGDSGSIPLGFLLGGLLIRLAAEGQLAAALILPAYYLADATITLVRRGARGERVWQAHRQHFYQRALISNPRHDRITLTILAANLVLVAAAVLAAAGHGLVGCALGGTAVAAVLTVLSLWSRKRMA